MLLAVAALLFILAAFAARAHWAGDPDRHAQRQTVEGEWHHTAAGDGVRIVAITERSRFPAARYAEPTLA